MNGSVENLALIRAALRQKGIDAYIITHSDPHFGEYITGHWKIIEWLTGFTGSAATIVITGSFAGLWTDSRYNVQAEQQLKDSGFEVLLSARYGLADYVDWFSSHLKSGSRLGFDGRIFSVRQLRQIENIPLLENYSFDDSCDVISGLWTERPPEPLSVAWDHAVEFTGLTRSEKIAMVRKRMKERKIHFHLLTSVDDIMWLLNIRGNDIPYSPLLISFAVIGEKQILLFVDDAKIPPELAAGFDNLDIVMLPYDEVYNIISLLDEGSNILIDPSTTSVTIYRSIYSRFKIIEDNTIPAELKAVKNRTEIANISKVMVEDGVALTKFFYYVENNVIRVPMTETSLSVKLLEFRGERINFLGPSFGTIAAYREHGALPHYSAVPETDAVIGERGLLLVDSGGQYKGGTTDITRTISIGFPAMQEKEDFTIVLKGHIKLAMTKFPLGTKGYQLDHLAREKLWEKGLDYGHGTGHGVGYCLNVHEGPQNIGPGYNKTAIKPGMLVTNEPGLYRVYEYGIRTENLMLCYEDEETEFGKFLKFDTLSLCYIEKQLIDISLLTDDEIRWLNAYHAQVFEKLSPHLDPEEVKWLAEKTSPV